ncbi:uncharacterized protein K02A2.6-like [Paramacrobiotus metropolitanus]|uniref:uncharacterized protein K02A2.6-like n=1 Tax=Paramacrobiotus metropolitanus TaxID=2943436 RepID=UPI002445C27D|nr:uncharacterized protein K02A2.6-like [Paramacrobiotus metropolitanus]
MDKDIERMSSECRICTERAKETAKVPLAQWEVPDAPWKRLHMDFAGPFHGTMMLVIVDAMSKWPEVIQMKHATSDGVLEALLNLFSRYGACTETVTDNGTQFTSQEFANFCTVHGIRHLRTPPVHPQSNGQAERYVQTFKDGISKLMADRKPLPTALREFLFRYRNAPQATTGKSPAELFLSRKLRGQLDLLVPVLMTTVERNRKRYQQNFDQRTKEKHFLVGEYVMVRDYRPNRAVDWQRGQLVKREGTRIWVVLVNGTDLRRHENKMRPRHWLHPAERALPNPPAAPVVPVPLKAPDVPNVPLASPAAPAQTALLNDVIPEAITKQDAGGQIGTGKTPELTLPSVDSAKPVKLANTKNAKKTPRVPEAKTDTSSQLKPPEAEVRRSGRDRKEPID